jgi:hypothetical protein
MDYRVAFVQGLYFLITGIWPLLSMKTFLLITGPKTDLWLVKTVGLILAVIGAVLLYAQMTGTINMPVILLAIGSALALALIEIIYVSKRVISPIYLADAVAEFILISWWTIDLWIAR